LFCRLSLGCFGFDLQGEEAGAKRMNDKKNKEKEEQKRRSHQ